MEKAESVLMKKSRKHLFQFYPARAELQCISSWPTVYKDEHKYIDNYYRGMLVRCRSVLIIHLHEPVNVFIQSRKTVLAWVLIVVCVCVCVT